MAQARGNFNTVRPAFDASALAALSARLTVPRAFTILPRGKPRLARRLRCGWLNESNAMFGKIARLFVIKSRIEAFLIIYALALGAVERGSVYLHQYPGFGGKLLFLACTGAVFMAGAKILDCLKHERAAEAASQAA
jgi:hypothetical protein